MTKRRVTQTENMRTILHSDLNNFYASVECIKNPALKNRPVVVVGSKEDRHGVVLAKNEIAKKMGVRTGDVYWEARQKCGKELAEVQANHADYRRVSKIVHKIYEQYTDRIESFGIDECWLDVTESVALFGGGRALAEELRERVKRETGLTVSVGVSWNKVFAKLGSDMKKPDAVTEITPENYKTTVWKLPVQELLYVGKRTQEKLNCIGVYTIGDLAAASEERLNSLLGKWGGYLYKYANGWDDSPVALAGEEEEVKSVSHSLTVYRDLINDDDVKMVIRLLADAVCSRVREMGLGRARTVHVSVRASDLHWFQKQGKLPVPTSNATEVAKAAFALYKELYRWEQPVRGVGVALSEFGEEARQLDLFGSEEQELKLQKLDGAIDGLRKKYGNHVIRSAILYSDPKIKDADVTIEPPPDEFI